MQQFSTFCYRPSVCAQGGYFGVHALLAGKAVLSATDFREVISASGREDLIYMDPPYQGTSFTRDRRYCNGLGCHEFTDTLQAMNDMDLSYIVSYDGQTGAKMHGKRLPRTLSFEHVHIHAGRSSQSTLLGDR